MKQTSSTIVVAAVLVLAGCRAEAPPTAKPATPVRVEGVTLIASSTAPRYSATIAPWSQVDVAAKANGFVRSIQQVKSADGRLRDIDQGDAIRRGVTLARLEDTDYQDKVKKASADLARSTASLEKSAADWKRARDLWATQSITAPDHDKARWEYESGLASVASSKAQLDEAKTNLGYTTVTAPLNGHVVKRKVDVGSLVGPGTVLFTVADMSLARVVFGVPDVGLSHATLGRALAITTESLPGRRFEGKVTSVSPAADSKTRVFQVEVTVPNPKGELREGMIAVLDLPASAAPGPASATVPLAALLAGDQPGSYVVYLDVQEGGRTIARRRAVEVGPVIGNRVVVTKGVADADRIIVAGNTLIRDGDAVRVLR